MEDKKESWFGCFLFFFSLLMVGGSPVCWLLLGVAKPAMSRWLTHQYSGYYSILGYQVV
jgi:hypothetical protein